MDHSGGVIWVDLLKEYVIDSYITIAASGHLMY